MQRQLDLHTGRPVWSAYRAPRVPVRRLIRDIKTEVVVIGMGISGAMIAEALSAASHDVVLIDRRGPGHGSTAANTALVQHEIDMPLSLLSRRIGREKAERGCRRSKLAVANLHARIADLGIRCNLVLRPSLYLDGDVLSPSDMRKEGAARAAAGLRSLYLPPAALKERFGIEGRSALLSHGNMALDPRKLTAGLLLRARANGARLYAPAEATAIETDVDRVRVATEGGPVVLAQHAVLATGYELMDVVPRAHHQIVSTYAIATRPQPRSIWPEKALIWEASDPYLYARTTPDGRVICGGEDEDFQSEDRRDSLIGAKSRRISDKLLKLFPQADFTPEFAWAGAFGTTSTGLPFIGRVPRNPRLFAVMGYGGNGITYSQIASELIATALAGGEDSDTDLFALPG
ncbi:FAD-dependent oxidoreductase [Mesorhizobium sp. LHD-90]|uniref:NAD(P)/FAD-dependent oxidoreductase n=1 Tax=Mesorhizobium sp. LHD-90 TaxID=3071414 RepID=UPI0027E1222B|nr:FAD-dependent oxidoreductase [Mesorhizobium sp. LHD-90]MDQ6433664.1 FAD-dependent oxidoreductase [Mesorhizobium sp. LHD-90]